MSQDRRPNGVHDMFREFPVHLLEETDDAFEQVLPTHLQEAGHGLGDYSDDQADHQHHYREPEQDIESLKHLGELYHLQHAPGG